MPTAQNIIERSMRLIGLLRPGKAATSNERDDALALFNEMIESWNNDSLIIYEESRETFTLTIALNPHTIGSGGTFDTTWPLNIQAASIVVVGSNNEYPVDVLRTAEEWQDVFDKSQTSIRPWKLWYEREFPLGKIWLYPVPSEAATLVLYLWKQLDAALTLATNLSVPPGYLRALRFNLAVEMATEFGVQVLPEVARIARESLAEIKKQNVRVPVLETDYPYRYAYGYRYNILTNR